MMGTIVVLAALALPGLPPASSSSVGMSPDSTIHLEQLVLLVKQQNPVLLAAELGAESMSYAEAQASSLPYPVFGVAFQPLPIHTARGTQRSQWRLEQAFPFPGKTRLQGEVARLAAERSSSDVSRLELDLILDLETTYSEAFRLQEEIDLVEEFAMDLERFKEAAAVQYELGRGHQQAVLRAQLEHMSLATKRIALETELSSAVERMARLTNETRLSSAATKLAAPSLLRQADSSAPVDEVMRRRPDAQSLQTALTLADARYRLAGKETLPDFAVHLTYFDIAAKTPPVGADGRDALAVGASVRIPLWGGQRRGKQGETQLQMRQAESELEALRSAIDTELRDLNQRIIGDRKRIELLRGTLIPQAETTLEATLTSYTSGSVGFLDLLDAERMLYQLRSEENSARGRLHTSVARLRHATANQ
jgi:outer membrane protein TolC